MLLPLIPVSISHHTQIHPVVLLSPHNRGLPLLRVVTITHATSSAEKLAHIKSSHLLIKQ